MPLMPVKQIDHLISHKRWFSFTLKSPAWTILLGNSNVSPVYGIDLQDIEWDIIDILFRFLNLGATDALYNITGGTFANAYDSVVSLVSILKHRYTKIYLMDNAGEPLYYNDGGNLQQVYGYLQNDIDGVGEKNGILFAYLKADKSGEGYLAASGDNINIINFPGDGGILLVRLVSVGQSSLLVPGDAVQEAEGIDEIGIVVDPGNWSNSISIVAIFGDGTTSALPKNDFVSIGAVDVNDDQLVTLQNDVGNSKIPRAPQDLNAIKIYVNGQNVRIRGNALVNCISEVTYIAGSPNQITFKFHTTGMFNLDKKDCITLEYELIP